MKFRFILLITLFLGLYGALGFNVYRLQIEDGARYIARAEARSALQEKLSLHRGQIFFTDKNRNKIPVAMMKEYPVIYAVPKEIKNPKAAARILAEGIGWEADELEEVLDNPQSLFRLLRDPASDEDQQAARDADITGIYIGGKERRYYPFEKLASHALGFVGTNKNHPTPTGLYGLEKFYEDILAEGVSINLTIDRNIQAHIEQLIRELKESFEAESGTIIVQDPHTGKILAMAHVPDFDPNTYSEFPLENFINPAVQSMYEAGSVFKPITMSAGIDTGAITPETTFNDTGSVTRSGKTIKNWDKKAHGIITMTEVIEGSINTGTVFAIEKTGRAQFLEYIEKFGFGDVSAIDLPDEIAGSIKNVGPDAREIDIATASFGQGTAVTPIQLISSFSALANGGTLMQPSFNDDEKPYTVRRAVTEDTAKKVTAMMESAVEKAYVARLPNHRIAGKTGTAQIPDFKRGGYADEFVHTYVGFGPVSNPKFVALVKLDKPNVTLAGHTVVPAFKELAQFILSYYNVPPDKGIE